MFYGQLYVSVVFSVLCSVLCSVLFSVLCSVLLDKTENQTENKTSNKTEHNPVLVFLSYFEIENKIISFFFQNKTISYKNKILMHQECQAETFEGELSRRRAPREFERPGRHAAKLGGNGLFPMTANWGSTPGNAQRNHAVVLLLRDSHAARSPEFFIR